MKNFIFATICIIGLLENIYAQLPSASTVLKGQLQDEAGAVVVNAKITISNLSNTVLSVAHSDENGSFKLMNLYAGNYILLVEASGFQPYKQVFKVAQDGFPSLLTIVLQITSLTSEVTITSDRGAAVEVDNSPSVASVLGKFELQSRPLPTIGNALDNSPGAFIQQSTYGQVSPFLRGLTGYQVLNLVDGIRFNNSTFRSGPNQYLAFIEPSQVQQLEMMLGTSSSQYGSDALGGTIQVLTNAPRFGEKISSELQLFGASADRSGGINGKVSFGAKNLSLLFGGSFRRHDDLRAGGGNDSRNVLRRFFGLPNKQIRDIYGSRLQDTGFSQFGGFVKFVARLDESQNLTFYYQQTEINNVRGYKDLWGGLGRLQSRFEPQNFRFFYLRYEKLRLGFLDSLSGTFSLNSQKDGSIRQGLLASDTIIRDNNLVNSFGFAVQATTHIGNRQAIVFGGEIYDERISATRFDTNPMTNSIIGRRALYPNGSRYTTTGVFAQNRIDIFRNKLWTIFGGRWTRIKFNTSADKNRDANGVSLGVIDSSQSFNDLTYNLTLTWQANNNITFYFIHGRGFRAPNLNDLGALGLNDLGFEVPAEAASFANGQIGVSDGEGIGTNGRAVSALQSERLYNYELGITFKNRKTYARLQLFDAELKSPIVRRTLLFPANQIPTSLAGISVLPLPQTATQNTQNVVSVSTVLDPRAIKAFVNDGAARYYGFEAIFNYAFSPQWAVKSNYSYIIGRELNPNRFIRRLPPPNGFFALQYQPKRGFLSLKFLELSVNVASDQKRLSGGDITDERIGAARRRSDIATFFNGSLIRPFINAGADGIFGTSDDRFMPTNETLIQIQNRVLPIGANINGAVITDDTTRVPLFIKENRFASLNLRGSFGLTEKTSLNFGLMNFTDRNYRAHGSGTDSPGINLWMGLKFSF